MRSRLWMLAGILVVSLAQASDFDAANQAYEKGEFAAAKLGYERIVESGQGTANVFYNLGNTALRLEQPGEALLNYERTLVLDPPHPEAQANRALVRSQVGAIQWPSSVLDRLFPESWIHLIAPAGCVAGWFLVFSVVLAAMYRRRRGAGFWLSVSGAVMVAAYATVALWRYEHSLTRALVIAKSAEVHLAPAESAARANVLPAGSEVRVLSERGDWVYCALPTAGRGWLPAKAVARIRLGES